MNDSDRRELDRLKQRLGSVRQELDLLWGQVQELEARQGRDQAPVATAPPAPARQELRPPPLPSLPPTAVVSSSSAASAASAAPVPAAPTPSVAPAPLPAPAPAVAVSSLQEGSTAPPEVGGAAGGSLELQVGSYWLVRVGIVLLLTGMVFFGMYAYEHLIVKMGAGARIGLLYVGSFLLVGLGAWLQRRQESVRNYGQILFGGGLAAVYFTTYAAHHVPNLRIIPSAVVDGVLLLGWTGFMGWLADRRRQELLAGFAIGLAFYTSAITGAGWFTLYSNLLLAGAAFGLFLRHGWTRLSFVSLVATYAGYAFWWFHRDAAWSWSAGGIWGARSFLAAYWILFAVMGFVARAEAMARAERVFWLTLNNGAAFTLQTLVFLQRDEPGFWLFALGMGTVLLGGAVVAERRLPSIPAMRDAYAVQGIVLVTTGCIAKFSGLTLALVLGVESTLLMLLSAVPGARRVRWVALIVAAIGTMSGLGRFQQHHLPDLVLAVGLGLLFLFNAGWSRRGTPEGAGTVPQPVALAFSFLAMALGLAAVWNNTSHAAYPAVLMAVAVVLTLSVHGVRVPEIPLVAQGLVLLAQAAWILQATGAAAARPPAWQPAFVTVASLGLAHWWQRQRLVRVDARMGSALQAVYGLAAVLVLQHWLEPIAGETLWLVVASGLAVALTVHGAVTRSFPIAAAAQLLLAVAAWQFLRQTSGGHPPAGAALAPMAAFLVVGRIVARRADRIPVTMAGGGSAGEWVAGVYRWTGFLFALLWIFEYVAEEWQPLVLGAMGAAGFGWSGWRRNREALVAALLFSGVGCLRFFLDYLGGRFVPQWEQLLAFGLLLGQQRVARRWADRFPAEVHGPLIVAAGLGIWGWVSRFIASGTEGFLLTATWAGLAFLFLLAGLLVRERAYRWLAFGILAAALGRILLVDVWKLDTLYRIVSFVALGVVLLALGFIYNRYQEKIRSWL